MVEIDAPLTPASYDAFVAPWNQANPKAKVEPYNIGGGDADKYEKLLTFAAAGTPIAGKATAAPSACRRSVRREVKDEPGMPTPLALTNTDIVTDPDLRSPTTTSRLNHAS